MKDKTFNSELASKKQLEFCEEHDLPMFAPSKGRCSKCRKDIYKFISVKEASERFITRCPYCNNSFCE